MKTFKFSLVLRIRENTDVFISLDDNIYGIHRKRINILYLLRNKKIIMWIPCFIWSYTNDDYSSLIISFESYFRQI